MRPGPQPASATGPAAPVARARRTRQARPGPPDEAGQLVPQQAGVVGRDRVVGGPGGGRSPAGSMDSSTPRPYCGRAIAVPANRGSIPGQTAGGLAQPRAGIGAHDTHLDNRHNLYFGRAESRVMRRPGDFAGLSGDGCAQGRHHGAARLPLAQHPGLYDLRPRRGARALPDRRPAADAGRTGRRAEHRERVWRRADYEALFDAAPPGTLRGELTPLYMYDRDAMRRIRKAVPDGRADRDRPGPGGAVPLQLDPPVVGRTGAHRRFRPGLRRGAAAD